LTKILEKSLLTNLSILIIINCWVEFGGGQTKTPTNFREIRNQNIWGYKYIKFLDIQVSCPRMYTYRFDKNIGKIFVN
jgi:hypothetical protein